MPVAAVLWELWQLAHAWEQRKFGDLLNYERPDKYIVKNTRYISSGTPVLTANKSFILGYSHETNSYHNLPAIIFDDFTLDNKLVYFPFLVKSSAIKILTSRGQYPLRFIYELLQHTRFINEGHARHYISVVQKKNVMVPLATEEQTKIDNIFSKLDKLIALQQRKLDLLKALRKAFLQELFANKNDQQPKLRFAGFDSDWETRRASNIFTERKEKSDEKQLLSVSINGGITPFDESKRKNNSSKDKHNYRLVLPGDIAYNSMRMWQGALGVSSLEGIVSPAYTVIIPRKGEDADFYYYMFKRTDSLHVFQRHSQGLTSDTWNLKFPLFKSINFSTTTTQEQGKIANILLCLDRNISHQQDKLDESTSLKKSLLQKMFI